MPLYENAETLARENKAKARLESVHGLIFNKLPIHYKLDYAVTKRDSADIIAWCELKCRDFAHNRYDDLLLSFEKVLAARELYQATGLPAWLYVEFSDGVMSRIKLSLFSDWQPEWGGRTVKKRREADVHPVVKIPFSEFEVIIKGQG